MSKKKKPPIRHRVAKIVTKIPIIREVVTPILPPEPPPVEDSVPDSHGGTGWIAGVILGAAILGYLYVSKGCPPEPQPVPPAVVSPTPTETPSPTATPTPSPSATDTPQPTATSTPHHRGHKGHFVCKGGEPVGHAGCTEAP